MNKLTSAPDIAGRTPFCGIISIAIQLIGYSVGAYTFCHARFFGHIEGRGELALAANSVFVGAVTFLIGFIFALGAGMRGETPKLFLNFAFALQLVLPALIVCWSLHEWVSR